MKFLVLIWSTLILVIICLMFIPYGYSDWTLESANFKAQTNNTSQYHVEWIYYKHFFIFSQPHHTDWEIQQGITDNFIKAIDDGTDSVITDYNIKDMQILWHIVFIEITIVLLIMGNILLTLIWKQDRKSSLEK